jgi:hypothetical protein
MLPLLEAAGVAPLDDALAVCRRQVQLAPAASTKAPPVR